MKQGYQKEGFLKPGEVDNVRYKLLPPTPPPSALASLQQLSTVEGWLASEPPQLRAPNDSWARGCGIGRLES